MIAYEVPLDPLSLVDFLYWPYTVLLWPGLMVLWYLKSQVQQTSCPCKELELIAVPLKVNATNDYQEEISNCLDILYFVNRNPSVRGIDCVKPRSITKYLNQLSIVIGSLLILVIIVKPVTVGLLARTCPPFTVTVFSSIIQILCWWPYCGRFW